MNVANVDWKLVVPGLGLLVSLIFNVVQWRWSRRPDVVEWEIDEHYRLDLPRDLTRFATHLQDQNPQEGDTGILIKVRYHGRHSLKVSALAFEWNFRPHARVPIVPCTLHDGNAWEGLIFTRTVAMDQITAVLFEGEGGRVYRQEINRDYHERFAMHTGRHD